MHAFITNRNTKTIFNTNTTDYWIKFMDDWPRHILWLNWAKKKLWISNHNCNYIIAFFTGFPMVPVLLLNSWIKFMDDWPRHILWLNWAKKKLWISNHNCNYIIAFFTGFPMVPVLLLNSWIKFMDDWPCHILWLNWAKKKVMNFEPQLQLYNSIFHGLSNGTCLIFIFLHVPKIWR